MLICSRREVPKRFYDYYGYCKFIAQNNRLYVIILILAYNIFTIKLKNPTFSLDWDRLNVLRMSLRGSFRGLAVEVLAFGVSACKCDLRMLGVFGVCGFSSFCDGKTLLSLPSNWWPRVGIASSWDFLGIRSKLSVVCIFGVASPISFFLFVAGLNELRAPGRTTSKVGFFCSQALRFSAVGALGPANNLPDFLSYTITYK